MVAPPSTRTVPRGCLLRRAGGFFRSRCPYYANTDATLQSCRLRLLEAGDVEPNPGPQATETPAQAEQRAITISTQNVRSLRNKLHTLRSHAGELETFSVIAITETWLQEETSDAELQFGLPNHTWFRRDRVTHGGGVACAVQNHLHPFRRLDLEPEHAEMLVVELKTAPSLLIAVCYCKPAPDDGALERTMTALQALVARHPSRRIAAVGDFNIPDIKWSQSDHGWARPAVTRPSKRASDFLDHCALAGLTQHVCCPTRGDNTLDLVLSNKLEMDVNVRDGVFESDHQEIVCSLRSVRGCVPLVTRTTAFNYKQADFAGLRRALELIPWSVLDNMAVDEAVDVFYCFLDAAIRDFIPVTTIKRKYPPWFDRELRHVLREKEAAFRRLKRNRCEDSIVDFRQKRSNFKNSCDMKYSEYLIGLTEELKTNPKRFWTFLKSVKGGSRGLPSLKHDEVMVNDDRERANLLNRTFAAKFTEPNADGLPAAPVYDLPRLASFHCDIGTVQAILRDIPINKACGADGISARIIKECCDVLAVPITKLCNLSLTQGTFPKDWKLANVVAIHKKGNRHDPKNYRSVSLIPLFGKVLERVVYSQLLTHVRPVLSVTQHGFMAGRSCATNLATLLSTAWDSISAGTQTDCVYTDFTAAFQSVDHSLLLHKLQHSFYLSDLALSWFSSYLHERRQRVIVNGKCSDWTPVSSGTPEGGLLSPLLFAMFINDLPAQIQSPCLMFADDVKIYRKITCAADAALLQEDLQRLCRWSQVWKLNLNPTKCKSFRMTLKKLPIQSIYFVGNTALEHVDTIRDLGVILDQKLTFGAHIDNTVKKANRALGLLIRSFQKSKARGYFNPSSIRVSYFAHVRSVLEYCCVIWAGAAKVHLDRLERIQHKYLMWLNHHCPRQAASISLSYSDLLEHFRMTSLKGRRVQQDIMFIRNVFRGKVDSPPLLEKFMLSAPVRVGRLLSLFHIPYARVCTVRDGLFARLPRVTNEFLRLCPTSDLFHDTFYTFRTAVMSYVSSL